MSVLEGPRREVPHVIKDGGEPWVEFKDGRIVFSDGVRRVALGNEERLPDKFKQIS